jgi:DNA-binding transcriptional regulator YhcF (GntR family)
VSRPEAHAAHLYEQLASDVAASISRGTLRPGDRLPSVRRFSEERGVSIATVLQAYVQLENAGLVEVRPKSGHFVRSRRALSLAEPRVARKAPAPARIDVASGVAALVQALSDP